VSRHMTNRHMTQGAVRQTGSRRLLGAWAMAVVGWLCLAPLSWSQQEQVEPSVKVILGTDRENIYQNELFMLTLEIVSSNIRLGQRVELNGLPDGTSLVMGPLEEQPIERSLEGRTVVERRHYRARCRALTAAPLRLAPTVTASQIVQRRMFIGRQWVETPFTLRVDPIEISITPLPSPPADRRFSGAVGSFSFAVDPQPLDVAVGDLIKLKISIQGTGYLDTTSSPGIAPHSGFRVYPPKLLEKSPDSIAFEQVLIPLSTNMTTIPALTLTTFDARAGSYQTHTQGPFQLAFHARRSVDRSQQYRPTVQASDPTQAGPATPVLALRKPASSDPVVADAHQAAALAYSSGYAAAALDAYAALQDQGDAWLAYNRGVIHLASGAYGEAIAQLLRSLHTDPHSDDALKALARACDVAGVTLPEWLSSRKGRWWRASMWEQAAVLSEPVEARLAPSASAHALFTCQAGDVLLIRERSSTWLSIQRGRDMGWVPAAAVIRLEEPGKQPNR